jgi:vesicular inhibitory amino acid transporter
MWQVSKDLLNTPGYNPYLNQIALWMLVISPLSKFALSTRPVSFICLVFVLVSWLSQLNITLEIMLGLETGLQPTSPEDRPAKPTTLSIHKSSSEPHLTLKRILTVVERVVLTLLSVAVSILVPEFSSVMAFLGSFSAFMLCVIGPVSAKSALAGRWSVWDVLLLIVAVIMAVWGTVAAFWSS